MEKDDCGHLWLSNPCNNNNNNENNKTSKHSDERPHCMSCRYSGLIDPFCCVHCSRDSQYFSVGQTNPQNCPFSWEILNPSNNGSLGPEVSPPPNGISIGSAIFAGLMDMTDSQTYRQPYSIASNGSHLAIAVRLPNNSNHDMAIATVLPVHLV